MSSYNGLWRFKIDILSKLFREWGFWGERFLLSVGCFDRGQRNPKTIASRLARVCHQSSGNVEDRNISDWKGSQKRPVLIIG